jgi:hypothetical protein
MSGSYSTTTWSWGTAFVDDSLLYETFLQNRHVVSDRLADLNPDVLTDMQVLDTMSGQYYRYGYGPNQSSVLLTSFLATYLGKDAATYGFSPFLDFPLPNWSINYNGLNKIPGVSSPMPKGAFYTIARLPIDDSEIFCRWMLETFRYENQTVMMAPAAGFYATPGLGKNEVRLAYVINTDDLQKALKCLEEGLKAYPGNTY